MLIILISHQNSDYREDFSLFVQAKYPTRHYTTKAPYVAKAQTCGTGW